MDDILPRRSILIWGIARSPRDVYPAAPALWHRAAERSIHLAFGNVEVERAPKPCPFATKDRNRLASDVAACPRGYT